ncbi:hypothetical protein IJI31_07690 [bacterium]|nr:hypothetical protein [bacterium]
MVDAINQNVNASLYGIVSDIRLNRTKDNNSIYDAENPVTSNDCVRIYLKGEEEIYKLINRRLWTIMNFSADVSKIAEEIRADYEQKHPEYVAAKREFENLYSDTIKKHDEYISEHIKKWEDEHPLNPYGTIGVLTAHDNNRRKQLTLLEKEYRSQNPDYDTYKNQTDLIKANKKPSFTKSILV